MNKTPILIGIVVVIIAAVAGGVFLLTKDNDSDKKKSDDTSENSISDMNEKDLNALKDLVGNLDEEDLAAIDDSDNAGVNACDLLTKSEAEKLLNGNVVQDTASGSTSCTYSISDTTTGGFALVTLIVSKSTKDGAKAMYDAAKSGTYGNTGEDVDLNGADKAYWASGYSQLSVLKGDMWFIVSAISMDATDGKDLSIEAAKLVLN